MNSVDQFAKNLNKLIDDRNDRKPSPKDDQVTVTKVEGDTVWVHFPGGVDETPVQRTLDAKVGDTVTVRRAEGKAWITGNNSSPPTDDTTANYAVNISNEAKKDVTILNTVVAENIEATNARFGNVEADTAKIHNLTADQINATVGYIEDLTADHITASHISADHATVGSLDTNYAHITNGVIDNAKIGVADVNNLSANYAQINAANVTDLSAQNAWVNKIMVQTGLLAHEGAIFTLDAIQVNAANITAGTIDVNRLIVTVDGEKYLVEIDPTTHQPSYEKLDGGIVEPRTITADKIVAHDITVQEITTENLVGTNGWINLNQGKFRYTTNGTTLANSTNGIEWDGTNLKIKGSVDVTAGNVYTKTESDERFGDHLYVDTTYSGSNIVFTARAILDGIDVTSQYLDGDFEWFYRTPTGDVPMHINGKSISIPQASQEYGRTVVCIFSRNQYANLLTNTGNKLRISTGAYLLGRSEY